MADDFDEMIVLPWKVWWRICEVSLTDRYCTKARHGFKGRPSGSQTESNIFMCIWQDRPTYATVVKVCFVTLICSSSFVNCWSRLRRRTARKTACYFLLLRWSFKTSDGKMERKLLINRVTVYIVFLTVKLVILRWLYSLISGKILAFIIMKCPCMDFPPRKHWF